ncbi:hypothetical protein DY000_02056291 [Brassica cretica]|uniref:Uncharacterized protein n=1 Tax=Brassica cretica TaxID=69181 RepID=A0ABQ7AI63_BRACR|nr:hypothetical protein DY000_02056291 [Brassica cretica]
MGKLGKKARKFAKKNLQSVEKKNRKQKPFLKRKFAKSNFLFLIILETNLLYGRRDAEGEEEEEKMIEQPLKKR